MKRIGTLASIVAVSALVLGMPVLAAETAAPPAAATPGDQIKADTKATTDAAKGTADAAKKDVKAKAKTAKHKKKATTEHAKAKTEAAKDTVKQEGAAAKDATKDAAKDVTKP